METLRMKKIFFFTFAVVLFIGTVPALAQTATQVAKLLAGDGAMNDQFGTSISVDGDTAVVGAHFDDDIATNSGSAYVFVRNPSDGTWTQQAKLTAADAAAVDQFGISVSVSGDTAVIGSFGNDDAGSTSGSAYVFTRSGSTWTQQAKLTAADASTGDHFGISVSVSGDTAVVGAYFDDDKGANSGSAYVFVRNPSDGTWRQQTKLTASDGAFGDLFGKSVAINVDTAVVGANQDDDAGKNSGSAYVFTRSGTMWTQQAKLTAGDAAASDNFGFSASVSDDTAVIGAWLDNDASLQSGSAYVFTRSGSTWTHQAKLTAADAALADHFGISVSVSGDTAVVGANQDDDAGSNSGSAYIFVRNPSDGTWTQQAKLTAGDAAPGDNFGSSVSVSDDTAVVGAHFDDDAVINSNSGSAYVFSLTPPNTPPVAYAGSDQTVECTSPSGASVTLDGSGSTDPDEDLLTYTWEWMDGMATGVSPTVNMPMNTSPTITNVNLVVSDGSVDSEPDTVMITVVDTTAPAVTAKLVSVKLKKKHGCFRVEFSATDICDADPTVVALLNGVSVTNGQLVKLKYKKKKLKKYHGDDGKKKKKRKKHHDDDKSSDDGNSGSCGDIKLAGHSFTLEVTATDETGNVGTGSDTFVFPFRHGDDGSSDDRKLKKKR